MTVASQPYPERPSADEYFAYYGQYIHLVPAGNILDHLAEQSKQTRALLAPLTLEQTNYRPKPADWNILEVIGHIVDAERVFAYRALCFARTDPGPLPSFDQDRFVTNAQFAQRTLADLLDELMVVRQASLFLFRHLTEEAWLRQGVASDNPISVRALVYIIAGHELHHVVDFRARYGVTA